MSGTNILKESLNALAELYTKQKGKQANAQELMEYAQNLETRGVNLFDTLDDAFDKDGIKGNSVSSSRFFANGNNLLFQTEAGEVVSYSINTGNVKIATNSDMASMLDMLDDGIVNSSIDEVTVRAGEMELGENSIKLFNSYKLLEKEIKTEDKTDKTLTVSSSDVEGLLAQISGSLKGVDADDVKESDIVSYIKSLKNGGSSDDIKKSKEIIENFLLSKFGGSQDEVLKNLTDMDISSTESGYLEEIRKQAFISIVDKVYDEVLNAFVDNPSFENNSIEFDLDGIKSLKFDFTNESKQTLTVGQVDSKSTGFISYLNGLGINATVNDQITMNADGTVSVKGVRLDQSKTNDGNQGNFSMSSEDVKNLTAQMTGKSESEQKTIINTYLKNMFGQDITGALGKILDESFSSSGAGYLSATRDAAFNKVVDIILAKVKAGYDDSIVNKDEVTSDIESYTGINVTKNDFKDINFGQKVTSDAVNDPNFIKYVSDNLGLSDQDASRISIDENGVISVNNNIAVTNGAPIVNPTIERKSIDTGYDEVTTVNLIISGQDLLDLQTKISQSADPAAIIKAYLQSKGLDANYADTVLNAVKGYKGGVNSVKLADNINLNEVKFNNLTINVGETHNLIKNLDTIPQDVRSQFTSSIQLRELEFLKDKNLLETVNDNGQILPKYLIAEGSRDHQYHVYSHLNDGTYLEVIGNDNRIKGKNDSLSLTGDFRILVSGNNYLYNIGNLCNLAKGMTSVPVVSGSCYTGSPLILDTDHDGKVEAEWGRGVDVNGDGKADGSASGGDKMLAMGDFDGDGKITGKEVFGDQTVDPFTGKKLNAANGFEALRMVADSAKKFTGISCLDKDGNVNLKKLKELLEIAGKGSLGLISDDNVTNLEGLSGIASVNVSSYVEQQEEGLIQHNQLGLFTDDSGKEHKIDDVWFGLA